MLCSGWMANFTAGMWDAMPDLAEAAPAGREPEIAPKRTVSTRRIPRGQGQHRAAPHNDPSSKYRTWQERIIAYSFPGHQPIYGKHYCPDCGAAMRWLPLRGGSDLVPQRSAGCVPPLPAQRSELTAKHTFNAIRMRQYRKFVRGRS